MTAKDPCRTGRAHGVDVGLLRAVSQHGLSPAVRVGEEHEIGRCAAEGNQTIGTDFTMGQIAQMIGYTTSSRFAELFKKSTGILPIKYRKIARKSQ